MGNLRIGAVILLAGCGLWFTPTANGSPLFHYTLNETTVSQNSTLADSTNSNNATVNATDATSIAGHFGNALNFPSAVGSTTGGSATVPATLGTLGWQSGPFTISAWVNPATLTTVDTGNGAPVFAQWGNTANDYTFWFHMDPTGGTFTLNMRNSDGNDIKASSSAAVHATAGAWHMITAVYDPTSATTSGTIVPAQMSFYLDGGTLAGGVQSTGAATTPATSDATMWQTRFYAAETYSIGLKADSVGNGRWNGGLDEMWMYNTALSPSQISSLFSTNAVPEPGSFTVLAVAAAGLLLKRHRLSPRARCS